MEYSTVVLLTYPFPLAHSLIVKWMKIKPFVIWRKGLALFRIIFESNFFIFMIFIIFNLAECSSMMTHDWKTTGHKNRLKHIKRSNKNSLRLWSKIMVKYMFVQMLFDLHKNWSYFIMASFAILLEHLDWLLYTNGFFVWAIPGLCFFIFVLSIQLTVSE